MMKRLNELHIYSWIFWGLLAILTASFLVLAILALYPYEPIRIDSLGVDKPEVRRGERLCYIFRGEKFWAVPVAVNIEMVNGENYPIMNYTTNNPVGVLFKPRCFVVPHHIDPGTYRVRWTGSYEMNAINTIRKQTFSEYFRVVE